MSALTAKDKAPKDEQSKTPLFQCARCGSCCIGKGGVWVNAQELERICDYLKVAEESLLAGYLEPKRNLHQVLTSSKGVCVFYTNGCSIHPVKPSMCRRWPFYQAVLASNWGFCEAKELCPGLADWDYPTFLAAFEAGD
jgi:Fe-S-cluster containining protein